MRRVRERRLQTVWSREYQLAFAMDCIHHLWCCFLSEDDLEKGGVLEMVCRARRLQ